MSNGEYFLMVMGIGFGLAVPTAIVATLLVQIRDRLDDRPLPPAPAPQPVLLAERITVTERIYGQPGALPAAALPAIVRSPNDRPAALIACAPLPVRRPPSPLPPVREEREHQYDADGRVIGWMEEW